MVRILRLQSVHMADVLRIQDQCYTTIEPESAESLGAKVSAAPDTCFVAQAGDEVVGYLIAAPVRFPRLPALNAGRFTVAPDADALYLHDLAVATAGRGTGAGQRLVEHATFAAKARGLRRACLVAIQGSAPYWHRFGFTPVPPQALPGISSLASYGAGAQLMAAPL